MNTNEVTPSRIGNMYNVYSAKFELNRPSQIMGKSSTWIKRQSVITKIAIENVKNANIEPASDRIHLFFIVADIPPIIDITPVMSNGPVALTSKTIGPGSAGIFQPLPIYAVRKTAMKIIDKID